MAGEEKQELSELLQRLMNLKGVDLERLAFATGIPRRFLSALINGEYDKLPGRPYVRGYLIKIASALDSSPDVLLQSYKDSVYKIKSAGTHDLMPQNRFADYSSGKNLAIISVVTIIIAGYLVFRLNDVFGVPNINFTSPVPDIVRMGDVRVEGSIRPGDKLTLNSEVIYTDQDGRFEKQVSLDPGLNTLEFAVTRFLGRETRVIKQIFYQPE
ncbi:MAG: helix-turn-helix domain-containing protein [Candidatus Colwellbacteria bacterium]|nr:helix-turn-helix domain-containing protein [Candidatus Colwellbacteria bacterium]